jgi:predicted Na+-dependent transporter
VPNTLELSARLSVFAFVVSSMLSMGLNLTIPQILKSFKSTRLVLLALVANFVLVPLATYLITKVIPMDQSVATGMLLLGTGAGAPFLPKLAEFAKGDLAFAVGLMLLLMAVTIFYMPAVLPMLLPGVHVGAWPIAKPLLTIMLTPLALGLLVRAYWKNFAARLQPFLRRASSVALMLAIALVLAVNFPNMARTITSNMIAAGTLLLLASLSLGFALGGPSPDTRKVLAFGTAQRDLSAALLVAMENFRQAEVVIMVIVVFLLGLVIQIPIALALGRRVNHNLSK